MTSDIPTRIYRQAMERSRQFWANEVGEKPFSVVVTGAIEETIKAERASADREIQRLLHALQQIADLGPSARGTPFGDIMASIAEEALNHKDGSP